MPHSAAARRHPQQTVPLTPPAIVRGESMAEAPRGLYIPPDALRILLEGFSGPLDLLLHLVRQYDLDVLDIDVSLVTGQYLKYIEAMQRLDISLVGDYLLMAATLVDLKARMLLPRPPVDDDDESGQDPRAELVARLCDYERFKRAALEIDALPRVDRDTWPAAVGVAPGQSGRPPPAVAAADLADALGALFRQASTLGGYSVDAEQLSVRERMVSVLSMLRANRCARFESLIDPAEGKLGLVVTFLALLELVHEALLEVVQDDPLGPLHLRVAG